MGAPKGNQYWKLAQNPGRPKIFASPEELWQKALDYFAWCEKNPLKEEVIHGKDSKVCTLNKMRAMTETGFRIFANIGIQTWSDYCSTKPEYKEFSEVSRRIKEIIYSQKFEGAAAGFLNHSIIARDLGLKDSNETHHTGSVQFTLPTGKDTTQSDLIE